jgi:hypothetical protein
LRAVINLGNPILAGRARSGRPRLSLPALVEEMKASGFIAAALARHGIQGASLAPPGGQFPLTLPRGGA